MQRNKYQKTEETNLQILQVLASSGTYSQYDLPKAVKKSYRTVLRRLQELEHDRLITLANKPLGEKDKKIYKLTIIGLVKYLGSLDDVPKGFNKIADKNKDLLVFFNVEYWDHLQDVGYRDYIAMCIWAVCQDLCKRLPYLLKEDKISVSEWRETWSRGAIEKEIVNLLVADLYPPLSPGLRHDLMYYLQNMSEIRLYIDRVYDEKIKETEERLKELKTWEREWETVKKTPYGPQKEALSNLDKHVERVHFSMHKDESTLVEWRELVLKDTGVYEMMTPIKECYVVGYKAMQP